MPQEQLRSVAVMGEEVKNIMRVRVAKLRNLVDYGWPLTICMIVAIFATPLRAQSLQAVPVISEVAGGTVCATATDAIGDGCPATKAKIAGPWGSVSDAAGNIYIADSTNNAIRKIDAKTGIITLVAGYSTTNCAIDTLYGNGCPATQVKLNSPRSPSFDHFGNLDFIDTSNNLLRSLNLQTNIVTNIAGTGVAATSIPSNTNPQPANKTAFASAVDFAFDAAGNLYITSSGKATVNLVVAIDGKIVPSQSLTYCLAGTGTAGHTGDGGPADQAEINAPRGVFVDPAGNIYFAEYGANTAGNTSRIRKITSPFTNGTLNLANAIITTVAGNGVVTNASTGNVGDGGQATVAELNDADDTFMDSAGNVYIVQYGGTGNIVRRVDANSQIITSYVGMTGATGTTGDGGPAVLATLGGPEAGHMDSFGRLYVTNTYSSNIRVAALNNILPWTNVGSTSAASTVIVKAANALTLQSAAIASSTPSAEFSIGTLSGCSIGGALAANAYCKLPVQFSPNAPGRRTAQLTLMDTNHVQSIIGLTGFASAPQFAFSSAIVSTIAGTGTAGSTNPTGPASAAQLNAPHGGAVDGAGNIYFADTDNNIIRKIDTTGNISTIAGVGAASFSGDGQAATMASLNAPADVAVDAAGNLFIADTGNNRIRYVDANTGLISTIAGNGTAAYAGDLGSPTQASLNQPHGVVLESDGTVDVADTGNNVVRRFFPGGAWITTIAGTGAAGYSGDGAQASYAQLSGPSAVAFDPTGNLYIADTGNSVVRMVAPWGQISTFAGQQGATQNAGDNGAATSASLASPTDVASDAAGSIYIASGAAVRLVQTNGIISTIVGDGSTPTYAGDGGPALSATLTASNLLLDASGNVYVSDAAASRLLEVHAATSGTVDLGVQAPMSTGSPQTITVLNTGNTPMSISALTVSTNYTLLNSGSNPCNTTTAIAPGLSCTISVAFSPTANGTYPGSITLTDNALNQTAATQTIPLTGVARTIAVTNTVVTISGPSPILYGAATPPTAIATITNGTNPTGKVTFTVNGISAGTVALSSNGTASIPLSGLHVGQSTIAASYQGDADNASSSGSTAVNVLPGILTVTANNASRPYGTQNPAFTYTVTGFGNGDTSAVLSGSPTFSTTAIPNAPVGAYTIQIAQGSLAAADYTFTFVNGTLTVTAGGQYGYVLAPAAPVLSLRATETPQEVLTLTPVGSFTGNVTLSCTSVPSSYTCSFSPGVVTMNGVVTQSSTLTLTNTHAMLHSQPVVWFGLLLPFAGCIAFRKKRRVFALAVVIALLVSAQGLIGCGSASVPSQYSVTVSATDNTAYPVTQTATFTVVPTN